MKKILLLICLFCSISITAFCADIDLNNKVRYEKLCDDLTSNVYIDKDSIKVLRNEYPFYSIQGDMITQVFTDDCNIIRWTIKYFYDKRTKDVQYQCIYYVCYDQNGNIIDNWVSHDNKLYSVDDSPATSLGCMRLFVICFNKGFQTDW